MSFEVVSSSIDLNLKELDVLLSEMKTDIDRVSGDLFELIETQSLSATTSMINASALHVKWLVNVATQTHRVATKARDHRDIFFHECRQLHQKCAQLDSFETYLHSIQDKLTSLEIAFQSISNPN